MRNPFRYFNSSPEVIRLVVMMYIRYPLSLRQVEDILFERGIDPPDDGEGPGDEAESWPAIEDVLAYRDRIRATLPELPSLYFSSTFREHILS